MGDVAIRVSGLGKQYRIGGSRKAYSTLRDTLSEAATRLVATLRGQRTRPENETIWALKDVSFEVKRGEVLGIIGRNGAGKSTLLKILSRITEPTCGEVDMYGRVGALLEVGTGFHPELTGRENIYLNGAVLGMRRREVQRKFDEIVDFSGIEKFIDTPVKHYSSGMYMRLAFAVAAHLEPEILIVDEVLAVGDIGFQRKCIKQIGQAVQSGRTALIVSHNLSLVSGLCPTTLWLDSGAIRQMDRTLDVIGAYAQETGQTNGSEDGVSIRAGGTAPKGHVATTSITIIDDNASLRRVFENGEFVTILAAISGTLPPASYFEWVLSNEKGEVATSGGTFMSGDGFRIPPNAKLIRTRIGPLPLAQGTYSLSTRLGVLPGHVLDEWEAAASIIISSYVPESNGLAFDSRRGVVYIPSTYHVSEQ